MNINLDQLFIDAICSMEPSVETCTKFFNTLGSYRPINPMHDAAEQWHWNRNLLNRSSIQDLHTIYNILKHKESESSYYYDESIVNES